MPLCYCVANKASQRLPYRSYRLTGKNLAGKKGRTGNNTRFAVFYFARKDFKTL